MKRDGLSTPNSPRDRLIFKPGARSSSGLKALSGRRSCDFCRNPWHWSDRTHPLRVEPLDPAVDGPGATEEQCGDGGPGVTVGQEQEDVGAESDLGVTVLTISVEQRLALPGVEGDATGHGCEFRVLDMSGSTQLYRPRLLSPLRGAI